ncbi:hypothetical protein BN1047_03891 [Mycolicibacterium neoaurum]|uniref:Uncharacterized protein n=1 Tax=Mycolicibacterium neoaurum TaxID=1795 RepID=A0AAV2WPX9_MYCNE|nr:hypothetical protein BN1047_03891 [Mycolicibacterium neoaurum]
MLGGGEAAHRDGDRLRPGSRALAAVGITQQWGGDPIALGGVGEGPAALVAIPLLIDLGIVTGQPAQHLSAPVIGALRTTRGAVFADAGRGHQVERPGAEPVGGPRERTDRTDLHGVAGEVRVEGLTVGDADLLQRTAFQQLDERVAGDLVGEPGAPGAEHTTLAIQQHLCREVDGLRIGPFHIGETRVRTTVRHRLVLQRALATLVAYRAVQRMIDQQQLHHAVLRLVGDLGGQLGAHHHVRGDRRRTGRQRFALSLDLHQALPTRPDRVQQRVIAEAGDLDAHQFGGPDEQRALRHADPVAVDGQRHHLHGGGVVGRSGERHARAPSFSASRLMYPQKWPWPGVHVSARGVMVTGRPPPWRTPSTRAGRTGTPTPDGPSTRRGST